MFLVPEKYRLKIGLFGSDNSYGNNGAFVVPLTDSLSDKVRAHVIASDIEHWEHVSVSLIDYNICPTWEMMCEIKDLFWSKDDCVLQFHPPKSEYVNCHPFTLHLWRPMNNPPNLPPTFLV